MHLINVVSKTAAIILIIAGYYQSSHGATPEEMRSFVEQNLGDKYYSDSIEEIVGFGPDVVPVLIDLYSHKGRPERVIECLCKIPTPGSIEFLKDVINTSDSSPVTHVAVRLFPKEHETEILGIVLDRLISKTNSYGFKDRILEILTRHPLETKVCISAMEPSPSTSGPNKIIGPLLAELSGDPNSKRGTEKELGICHQEYWKEWWNRNEGKERYQWLQETNAIGRLVELKEKRAVPYFLQALDSTSPVIAAYAIRGLRKFDDYEPLYSYGKDLAKIDQTVEIVDLKKRYADPSNPLPPLVESHEPIVGLSKAVVSLLEKHFPVVWWRPFEAGLGPTARFQSGKGPNFAPGIRVRCYNSEASSKENAPSWKADGDYNCHFSYNPGKYTGPIWLPDKGFTTFGKQTTWTAALYSEKLDCHLHVSFSPGNVYPELDRELRELFLKFDEYIE